MKKYQIDDRVLFVNNSGLDGESGTISGFYDIDSYENIWFYIVSLDNPEPIHEQKSIVMIYSCLEKL